MNGTLESCLTNDKIVVKFYRRRKGNITDNPKHVANGGMLDTAVKELVVPQLRSGQLVNVLTDDEKEFLEQEMRVNPGDLSIYNKQFWNKRKVALKKSDNHFDLSNPEEYIDYKILLANRNLVAPSLDVISHKQTYMFYIEREGEQEERQIKTLTNKQQAYKLFGKYEDNESILKYILRSSGKVVAKNTKLPAIQGWIGTFIDEKPELFVKIASDPLLKTKVLLNAAIDKGLITLRSSQLYDTETSKPIAAEGEESTLENAAAFINTPRQQEYKLALEAKLKNT